MLRGFVRENRAFPVSRQRKILLEAGVEDRAIYEGDLDGAIKSMRKDDMLAVAGLRSLGTSRAAIVGALDKLHDAGKCAIDVATMKRSDGRDAAKLMADAIADLANERRGGNGSDIARMGAAASAKARANGRMPLSMVELIWFDRTVSNAGAMERINGDPNYRKPYSLVTVYRLLGPRGTMPGRRTGKYGYGYIKNRVERTASRLGRVYFIRAIGGRGPVKIGWSSTPHSRIKELQTANGADLEIIAMIEGTMADEKALHERFARFRTTGEWFKVSGAFKTYLRALPKYDNRN